MKNPLPLFILLGSIATVSALAAAEPAPGKINAGLMQMPAVSKGHVAFCYAGDIWVAPRAGGAAFRLSSPRGEERNPRFSPDGQWIAFSGNYDGNTDLYVMPVTGGEPRRVTHHGANDRLLGWSPDGASLLFSTHMTAFTERVGQIYKVAASGGLPEKMPLAYGELAALSGDGKQLAYTPISTDNATWKRYRGGMASDIWLLPLGEKGAAARNLTNHPAKDSVPMWNGGTLYFLSDRDEHGRDNIWSLDPATGATKQITKFRDYDVKWPSIGPDAIVFENGGDLHILDLASGKTAPIQISVVTDRATLRPRVEAVGNQVRSWSLSPTAKRVAVEAHGEVFSTPVENGLTRNVTQSSGTAERSVAWSPDGKWIACFSDRTGEYELTLLPADGKGEARTVTNLGPGFRYSPQWSPDSKKVAYIDASMRLHLTEIESGKTRVIDQQKFLYHGELSNFGVSWSNDSRWLTYAGDLDIDQTAVILYDTKEGKRHQVTSGFYHDSSPVFDPDGRHLYYVSRRKFDPIYSDFDRTWVYANGDTLVAVPLRADLPSPLAPRNDEEPVKEEKKEEKKPDAPKPAEPAKDKAEEKAADKPADKPDDKKTEAQPQAAIKDEAKAKPEEKKDAPAEKKTEEKKTKELQIDLDGFESRGVVLPVGSGKLRGLSSVAGKVLFVTSERAGSNSGARKLYLWDIDKREERGVLDNVGGYEVSADGKKLLASVNGAYIVQNVEGGGAKTLNVSGLEAEVDPRAEWKQIFNDAWRIERDFFYDPHLHLVPWAALRERYATMLDDCVTRADVNFVIGELIAELNASHAYRSGGGLEDSNRRSVGYLGCDFTLEQGAYRISKIIRAAQWDGIRSPLAEPGVKAKQGDWLLAVNGRKLDTTKDPWAAFQGMAGRTVQLTLNDKPTKEGSREVLVTLMGSESGLRRAAWIERNRQRVAEATGGRAGYVYVPNTGVDGQSDLYRQFRPQFLKDGLIVDERWNAGGQIPERFIELLSRKTSAYWGVRDGNDWRTPFMSHDGPKVMLANAWSGSGGDCFPYMFRKAGLGPIVGTRTWGGLIGMTGAPTLIDGSSVTVPTFGIYDQTGQWIIEGKGVEPDIAVADDPAAMNDDRDPQLERAISELLKSLEKTPPKHPSKPAYQDRSGI